MTNVIKNGENIDDVYCWQRGISRTALGTTENYKDRAGGIKGTSVTEVGESLTGIGLILPIGASTVPPPVGCVADICGCLYKIASSSIDEEESPNCVVMKIDFEKYCDEDLTGQTPVLVLP